jgi:hypothetical protein
MGLRGLRSAVAALAATGVVIPVAALAPSWFASAPSAEATCIHITINLSGGSSSTCPPGEPGPELPPLNLNFITPDGQLNIPPIIVPNEPKPPLIPPIIPLPLAPLH